MQNSSKVLVSVMPWNIPCDRLRCNNKTWFTRSTGNNFSCISSSVKNNIWTNTNKRESYMMPADYPCVYVRVPVWYHHIIILSLYIYIYAIHMKHAHLSMLYVRDVKTKTNAIAGFCWHTLWHVSRCVDYCCCWWDDSIIVQNGLHISMSCVLI